MKRLFVCCWAVSHLCAAVSITKSPGGWTAGNGEIQLTLARSGAGIRLESLRRTGGAEWALPGTPVTPSLDEAAAWQFTGDTTADVANGAKQLTLQFKSGEGGLLSLEFRIYPAGAVIEFAAGLENRGPRTLPLVHRIDPLSLTLTTPARGLKPYSSIKGHHGFQPVANRSEFTDWLVLENGESGESALVGGELGLGVFSWRANTEQSAGGTLVRAGNIFRNNRKSRELSAYEVAPGRQVETPIAFLALAKGDPDDVGNEAFRYLKRYVMPKPVPNAPLAADCVWLTESNSESTLLNEVKFAQQVGFDVFYHDASWSQGASLLPGTNNWTQGLGHYRESPEKFPRGLKTVSDAARSAGMKFGLWVDPGNVDAKLVESGEIQNDWLAMIDGKVLSVEHPSLSPTRQLCLGDPKVVEYLKKQLSGVVEKWNLEWIKWDPSGTVDYACDRTDHGHGRSGGAYASYRGQLEILSYLMSRFPRLIGFEVEPSLNYSRTNPGPKDLLPGGYINEFITGPMVSPFVWGSYGAAGKGDARAAHLAGSWYSASALDFYIRKSLTHGIAFGNINGMASQLLSAAPPGYIDAFKRNLVQFKRYRHLLLEDVYHPKLESGEGWNALQYVKSGLSESVVFVFREDGGAAQNTVRLRGLDGGAKYRVTSLNDQPGRERVFTGQALMKDGIAEKLPDNWLVNGDGLPAKEFVDQLRYGSDILLLERL